MFVPIDNSHLLSTYGVNNFEGNNKDKDLNNNEHTKKVFRKVFTGKTVLNYSDIQLVKNYAFLKIIAKRTTNSDIFEKTKELTPELRFLYIMAISKTKQPPYIIISNMLRSGLLTLKEAIELNPYGDKEDNKAKWLNRLAQIVLRPKNYACEALKQHVISSINTNTFFKQAIENYQTQTKPTILSTLLDFGAKFISPIIITNRYKLMCLRKNATHLHNLIIQTAQTKTISKGTDFSGAPVYSTKPDGNVIQVNDYNKSPRQIASATDSSTGGDKNKHDKSNIAEPPKPAPTPPGTPTKNSYQPQPIITPANRPLQLSPSFGGTI